MPGRFSVATFPFLGLLHLCDPITEICLLQDLSIWFPWAHSKSCSSTNAGPPFHWSCCPPSLSLSISQSCSWCPINTLWMFSYPSPSLHLSFSQLNSKINYWSDFTFLSLIPVPSFVLIVLLDSPLICLLSSSVLLGFSVVLEKVRWFVSSPNSSIYANSWPSLVF